MHLSGGDQQFLASLRVVDLVGDLCRHYGLRPSAVQSHSRGGRRGHDAGSSRPTIGVPFAGRVNVGPPTDTRLNADVVVLNYKQKRPLAGVADREGPHDLTTL